MKLLDHIFQMGAVSVGADRVSVVDKLIEMCRPVYDVTMHGPERAPLAASCDFFQRTERYVLTRKINLWSVQNEEFMHIFSIDRLTLAEWEGMKGRVIDDGLSRAHPGSGHMSTRATAIVVCDEFDDDAADALRRSKFVKNYWLSLHGWLEFWAGAIECGGERRRASNRHGRTLEKMLAHAASGGAQKTL